MWNAARFLMLESACNCAIQYFAIFEELIPLGQAKNKSLSRLHIYSYDILVGIEDPPRGVQNRSNPSPATYLPKN